ncbi:putative major facilitator superfamily transporter [Gordonia effusa NBRC 100432]|uniref:Putative major facilitator superfamily transporter n=1 Tax=Gordonia effusa NBRC 100432 TaxID=1077974 RepID=H0QUR2_9ACTN|nr:MFS transporter [Gordonia effusa]GAB16563.1 putative major facilitator superfamily transporter [Gordonia effusa NBRC 100432]
MNAGVVRPGGTSSIPRGIWVLLAANVVIALGYGLVAPALPSFAHSFNVGLTAASAIVSVFAIMRLLFAPAAGRLVTKLGERWVYLTGLFIVAVSTFATAFAQTYWQLMLFRGLGGIGSTMFTVSAMALLIRMSPPDIRGKVSGYFSAGFLIGNITGPLIGSALVSYGLRLPFVVYSVALLVALGVVAVSLGDSYRSALGEGEVLENPLTLREALRDSAYRAILASNFAQGWASMGVRVAVVPLMITDGLHRDAAWSGIVMAAFAAGNVTAILLAGRLSDVRGRRVIMLPGLVVTAVATAVFGLSTHLAVVMVLSVVAGAGAGLFAPTQQAALADVLGSRAQGGSALAAFGMAADCGAVSGPIVVGFLAQQLGFGVAFAATGAVVAIALVMWLFARESAPAVILTPKIND